MIFCFLHLSKDILKKSLCFNELKTKFKVFSFWLFYEEIYENEIKFYELDQNLSRNK